MRNNRRFAAAANWMMPVGGALLFIATFHIIAATDNTSAEKTMSVDEIKGCLNKQAVQSFLDFANGRTCFERLDYMVPGSTYYVNDKTLDGYLPYSASACGRDFDITKPWDIGTNGIINLTQPEHYGCHSNILWAYLDGSIDTVFTNDLQALKPANQAVFMSQVIVEEAQLRFLTSMGLHRFFEPESMGFDWDSCRFTGRWNEVYAHTTQSLVLSKVDEMGRLTQATFQETNYRVCLLYSYEKKQANLPGWLPTSIGIWCSNSAYSGGLTDCITYFKPGECKSDILTNTTIRHWLYTSNGPVLISDIKSNK